MRQFIAKVLCLSVTLGFCFVAVSSVQAADRSAAQILKEIDAVKLPTLDSKKKTDRSAVVNNQIMRRESAQKRARLIRELYKVAPDNKRILPLMEERWSTLGSQLEKGKYDELIHELDDVLAHAKDRKLKIEASFNRAQLKLNPVSSKRVPDPSAVDNFLALAPKDPRGASLLGSAATATDDEKKKAALTERLVKEYPDSDMAGMLQGSHSKTESVGKIFHLEFTDAITGGTVSMTSLRGKVVVIDFWATWCGPCVAEMPKMKTLYAKFRDQGVEFIGVSLDQSKDKGGLDSLKKFVKEEGIEWPQYYQGKFWNGDFSKSWGINSIPCVFIVAADGKLYSAEARGKLEEMIPKLLERKGSIAAADNGADK
jgi:thiol-disulfide isomerase/thioredoxin